MGKLVAMKILKAFDRYNAGEVAGFEPATVALLKNQGIAKEYDAAEAAAEEAEAEAEAEHLRTRAAELDAREAELIAREKALAQAPAAGDPPLQGHGKK